MKMRNKGKVYPSPSLSSSSSSSSFTPSSNPPSKDALSVLKLLPAAILALASVLSLEDREVLAYMITRSLKSTNPSCVVKENKNNKKSIAHRPPIFDCECFDCYTSYWFRWDSSPNRELIHQVIEAFEEHLNKGEQSRNGSNRGGKKREKMGRRYNEKSVSILEVQGPEKDEVLHLYGESSSQVLLENDPSPLVDSHQKAEEALESGKEEDLELREPSPEESPPSESTVVVHDTATTNHKGLVRKVLPDVLGLFNSRLWSLWNPNV